MENLNVDITQKPVVTCVEWFHGYGGNALGLRRAIPGLQSVAVCERDAFVVANMVSKMEKGLLDAVPIWTDVTDFPCEPFGYQRLDFFAASYPCQGFSHAGKRLGKDDPRHLWPHCRKFIRTVRPGWVWLENVEGHVTLGLSTVLADLEEDGYTAAWGIFSASEVGAPHQRKRVFILAHRAHDGLPGRSVQDGIPERDIPQPALRGLENPQRADGELDKRNRNRSGNTETTGTPDKHSRPGICVPWPARPGESQYAWEPPRVVGNAGLQRQEERCLQTAGLEQSNKENGVVENPVSDGGRCKGGNAIHERRTTGKAWGECLSETAGWENGSSVTDDKSASGNGAENISQTQSSLGGNADGPAAGLDFPGCTGLSGSELEEIYGWMAKGTNRTDELRMCGNGVVPQTAERAFRVLYQELTRLSVGE